MMSMLRRASCTWDCAAAVFERAMSSLRLLVTLVELALHLVQAVLELVHHLGLRRDAGLGGLRLVFGRDLPLQGHLGEVVELLGVHGVALGAVLVGLPRGGQGLVAPVLGVLDVFVVVVLEHAQVADGLGDR
ncbi:hypothetical protein QFZ61_001698 [Arthrobacter sp. B3I4]|nr:hypothetical protein [Arthrobacter sp. B3I4]